ncbi:hypothetical protein DL95DRAFT_390430 [Leptodontidium sp. 2 PMI_412]|nr:hypothetical protein DL95DRAFT_390430 [Leptodontidium sp. 2 PMI_412]
MSVCVMFCMSSISRGSSLLNLVNASLQCICFLLLPKVLSVLWSARPTKANSHSLSSIYIERSHGWLRTLYGIGSGNGLGY